MIFNRVHDEKDLIMQNLLVKLHEGVIRALLVTENDDEQIFPYVAWTS